MRTVTFAEAIEEALVRAMIEDPNIIILGEDVHTIRRNLFVRFGDQRVIATPISESAFLGAAVAAAMAGIKPVVEIMLADFLGVAMDALLNHAAKLNDFSGGKWQLPLVVRTACGGGYGDGGQHQQALWGWLAHIPGLSVVVPSEPADAYGLMRSALAYGSPVIFFEHKLLVDHWLEFLGFGGRKTVTYDVPASGLKGPLTEPPDVIPIGKGAVRQMGDDITMISLGIGVHRCVEAAKLLKKAKITSSVIDLRTVVPLDKELICESVKKTGCLLCVDEDYEGFGLSGEIASIILESGLQPVFGRVCTKTTIPYARHLEDDVLPNVQRIYEMARILLKNKETTQLNTSK